MKYSKSTGGFYSPEFHGDNIPDDAVEIALEEHTALLDAQSLGKLIQADSAGKPVAVDHVPSSEELTISARTYRDNLINSVAWQYERNTREVRLGLTPTDDLALLDAYVQALADVPKQVGFPDSITWPVAP